MAQSVKHPTSAQVTISRFVGSGPVSGSVLTSQSLEPASDSVSPFLSLRPSPAHDLSLPLKYKMNIKKIFFKELVMLGFFLCVYFCLYSFHLSIFYEKLFLYLGERAGLGQRKRGRQRV